MDELIEPVLDKVGQPINIGYYIVYGHALGRCAGLRLGKVVDVKTKERFGKWTNPKDMVEYRITVWGVDDDWSHKEVQLLSKRSTLQFPERIIVLNENQVPAKIKALLDEIMPQ